MKAGEKDRREGRKKRSKRKKMRTEMKKDRGIKVEGKEVVKIMGPVREYLMNAVNGRLLLLKHKNFCVSTSSNVSP